MGHLLATLPIFATACGWSRTGAVHRLVGAVQEHRQFLRHPRTRSGARPVEHLLRLRRPGRLAVRRLVGVQRVRYLARGVLLQRRGGLAAWPCCSCCCSATAWRTSADQRRPQVASGAVRYAGFRPKGGNGGSLRRCSLARWCATARCSASAWPTFLPARQATSRSPPVGTGDCLGERMPALGKVGAAIVPTAFEVAGLLGLDPDRLRPRQAVRRTAPARVISLLALTVCLAPVRPRRATTGSIPIVVSFLLFMMD